MQNAFSNRVYGIFFKLLCLIFSTLLTLAFAHRKISIGIFEQIFCTSVSASIILLLWAAYRPSIKDNGGIIKTIKKMDMRWYVLRSFLSISAMSSWSYTAKEMGPNEATLLSYLIPVTTLVIAQISGMEKMHKSSIFGIIICISAVIISLEGDGKSGSIFNITVGLFTSTCWGLYDIICKKQSTTDDSVLQGFLVFFWGSIIALPLIYNTIVSVPLEDLIFSLGLGLIRVGIVFTMFLSYRYLTVNSLTVMSYLRLPIMISINYALFLQIPLFKTIMAAVLIVFTNLIIINYNKKIDKEMQ